MVHFISTTVLLNTQEGRGKDANETQEGRRSDAVQTQSRRRETPYGRIAEAARSMDAGRTHEGRRRKHQLLTSTYDIYCIWLFRSIKQIYVSFLVAFLCF